MRNTLKILPLMLGIMLFFTQCEKEALDTGVEIMLDYAEEFPNCNGWEPLYAGAGNNIPANGFQVGIVEWGIDGDNLYVRYTITKEGWTMTETHLWVGDDIADLPQNVPPGQLGNNRDHNFVDQYQYIIDITDFGRPLYLAAHATVVSGDEPYVVDDLEDLENKIPLDRVTFSIKANYNTSYHDLFLSQATEFFNGEYESYCADPTTSIAANKDYTAEMYSSLSAPEGLFPFEKYNEVNWVINNVSVGDTEVNGVTVANPINYADIQMAIWKLLYGDPDPDNPANWVNNSAISQAVADANPGNAAQIVAAANLNSDYVPGCGEYLVIFLVDLQPNGQSHLIWKPIICSETAWAFGDYTFIEVNKANKWGWIFKANCTP